MNILEETQVDKGDAEVDKEVVGHFLSCAHNVALVELRLPLFLPSRPLQSEVSKEDTHFRRNPPKLFCCPVGSSAVEVCTYLPEWWQQLEYVGD